jgi:hypothetical protein
MRVILGFGSGRSNCSRRGLRVSRIADHGDRGASLGDRWCSLSIIFFYPSLLPPCGTHSRAPSCMDLPSLNYQPGLGVQSAIRFRFGEPVNFFPVNGLKEFFLIASFGRCKFRLNEHSVGLILQATLGAIATDFKPIQISDRVFRFVVASKNVGFHIYNLRSFACEQYHIFFNLWGNGGANWVQEFRKYLAKEDDQWTLVHSKNFPAQKSFRDVV